MSIKVGLWIDHRKAIVVAITDRGEQIEEVVSGVEKQLQRAGENRQREASPRRFDSILLRNIRQQIKKIPPFK